MWDCPTTKSSEGGSSGWSRRREESRVGDGWGGVEEEGLERRSW